MARLRYNGLSATLGASLTTSATSITFGAALTYSGGVSVPTITANDYIPLSLLDSNGHLSEIVYLTAYTSGATSGTITRGREGTSGVAHNSGDKVVGAPLSADTPRDRRYWPAPGVLSIDEFNDDSLDSAWVRVDGTGAESTKATWTEGGDVLSAAQLGNDTSAKMHGIVRPLSAVGGSLSVGDAFLTAVTIQWPLVNFGVAYLVLTDNATFGSGTQVMSVLYPATSGSLTLTAATRTASGWTDVGSDTAAVLTPPGLVYLRLVMTAANTWRTDISSDGVSWVTGSATRAVTVTPTHVGLGFTSYGTATKAVHSFEFVRRASGVS